MIMSASLYAGHMTVDAGGRIIDADDAARGMFGMSASPDIGLRTVLDVTVAERVLGYLQCGDHSHGAVFDTAEMQIIVRAVPTPGLFTVVVENAAGREAAWRRFRLTQATVDRVTDMIIWLNPEGRYVFVNGAATDLLGYSAEELSTMRVVDVDPYFDEDRWRAHWQEVVERGSFTFETVNTTKTGENIPIEVTVNHVEFDGEQYNCSIVRNIAERKRIEAQLRGLTETVRQLSLTDDLTGIANRRHFDEALHDAIVAHTASGAALAILMLDIDHFKAFNDRYGHAAGDHCLCEVASVVARIADHTGGIAARYGGEEFLCILPNTDDPAARRVAADIQRGVAALAIPHEGSEVASVVTVSIGVHCCRALLDPAAMLAAVDARLYEAKRSGRNRID